jgi:hypothetical protein
VHIGGVADTGEHDSSIRPMYLAIVYTGEGFFGDELTTRAGRLSAVMCKGCGFTELYVLDPQNVQPDGRYIADMSGPRSSTPHR